MNKDLKDGEELKDLMRRGGREGMAFLAEERQQNPCPGGMQKPDRGYSALKGPWGL